MARPRNPQRKTELLTQIIDYLQDKPLAALTFRTLAEALDISTYVLVYHFGTREQLIHQIVSTVEGRADSLKHQDTGTWSRARYEEWINEMWCWVLHERSRQLRRLGFEAAMQDLVSPAPVRTAQKNFAHWLQHTRSWLIGQGVRPEDADVDSRLLVASLYGIGYDHVINDDAEAATAAFEALMKNFWCTLDERLSG